MLLTPFHNMARMSPATTEAGVDAHSAVFEGMAAELGRVNDGREPQAAPRPAP